MLNKGLLIWETSRREGRGALLGGGALYIRLLGYINIVHVYFVALYSDCTYQE